MAGLDPAIYVLSPAWKSGCRVKRGHDAIPTFYAML